MIDPKDAYKSDFEIERKVEVNSQKSEEKEEKKYNLLFGSMIIVTAIGTALIVHKLHDFRTDLIEKNPSYNFPKYEDMYISIGITAILIAAKILIEKYTMPISELIISNKYQNPEDLDNFTLGKIYKKKLATNIFKLIFYTITSIMGYFILHELEYFPVTLGGNGKFSKMFENGYPDSFYHKKPLYFDLYYMSGLSFCVTDLIWLVFIYELQSDFILMLLHHFCTISLISFSFLTNYSNVGCLVMFLHDIGDVFVYITRIVINTDAKSSVKLATAGFLQIVFIYTRIIIFGDLISTIYTSISWGFKWPDTSLLLFLVFLYIMHVNWVYLIMKKIFSGLIKGKWEDPASIKKISKEN